MKYLIDTHVLIKYLQGNGNLPKKIVAIINDERNDIFLSTASLWEMAIKISIGKLKLAVTFPELEHKFNIYDFNFRHMEKLIHLPFHHQDPFVRLLIAQGMVDHIPIITQDKIFLLYKIKTIS